MMKIDKKTISFDLGNSYQYSIIYNMDFPEYSEILDTFLLDSNTIGILYKYDISITNIKNVSFSIHIDTVHSNFIDDDFTFLKTLTIERNTIDLSKSYNGFIIPQSEFFNLYIFLDNQKTLSEIRSEKLNSIL